jgi:hypothetical protein
MQRSHIFKWIFVSVLTAIALGACAGGPEGASADLGSTIGASTPSGGQTMSCGTGDLCLALKMVSYSDGSSPVMDSGTAQDMVARINAVWSQCGIGFRLEDYQAVEPKNVGLPETIETMSELPQIRGALQSPHRLLVVLTSPWGSAGDINDSGADAWTTLPGNAPYGAIIDQPVSRNANIIAHELGHYLGLLHVRNRSNLLSPIVGGSSRGLSSGQCSQARATAVGTWAAMLRS